MGIARLVPCAVLLVACSTTSTDGNPGAPAPTATAPRPGPAPAPEAPPPEQYNPTNDPNAQACTGDPGTIYAIDVPRLVDSMPIPMCRFKGKVLLVVNTASHCGYTPEYGPLETIYTKYAAQGFFVL
ncbi:MAG TPA: hypothetical protein VIF62_20600, partial [Labilithrix sp.]